MAQVFVSWPGYEPSDDLTGGRLRAAAHEIILHPKLGARSPAELATLMGDADAAIVSTDPFTEAVIAGNPKLRIIARVGVGTDSIDHEAAMRHGVAISITPGMNAETVADQTLALILSLVRKIIPQDSSVRAGRWERVGPLTPYELYGKSVGLIGAGAIGRAVRRRLSGFDARVLFYDEFVSVLEGAEKVATLDDLLWRSDVVSLHAPLTPETRGIIGASALNRMKPSAFLINTSRGPLVDQRALFNALRSGAIAGAALDVFEEEPPGAAALADVPNLVVSAHVGGLSHESIRRMTVSATDSVLAVLAGECPDTVINPGALKQSRR